MKIEVKKAIKESLGTETAFVDLISDKLSKNQKYENSDIFSSSNEAMRIGDGNRCRGLVFSAIDPLGDKFIHVEDFKQYVEKEGGTFTKKIDKKVNFLVTNDPFRKSLVIKKANSLEIPVISDKHFIELFGEHAENTHENHEIVTEGDVDTIDKVLYQDTKNNRDDVQKLDDQECNRDVKPEVKPPEEKETSSYDLDSNNTENQKGTSRKKVWMIAPIILLVLALIACLTIDPFGLFKRQEQVPVFDSYESAELWAHDHNMEIEIVEVEGMDDGYELLENKIIYRKSIGVQVPNFIGLTDTEASELAYEKGFVIFFDRTEGNDIVKSQDILEGNITKSSITLVLENKSSGDSDTVIDVPNAGDEDENQNGNQNVLPGDNIPSADPDNGEQNNDHPVVLKKFKEGDKVRITGSYKSNSLGEGLDHTRMQGYDVTIVEVYEGRPFPYALANNGVIIGFASENDIQNLAAGGILYGGR